MARKKHLINVHTSTGTTAPTGASLYLGEIAVQHTPNDPALWIKVGSAETSTEYEKFIGKTEIINLLEDTKILGSGYTYSGLSYINSSTTIADAFSALTNEMIKDEKVVAAALNDLNGRVDEISAATGDNTELLEYLQENEEVVAGALNNLNERVGVVETHMTGDYIPITGYQTATGTSEEELSLEETDTVNEALGKLQKQMLDNEESIAAGLNDLNTRLDNVDDIIAHNTGITQLSGAVQSFSAATYYQFGDVLDSLYQKADYNDLYNLSGATIRLSAFTQYLSGKTLGVLTVNLNGVEQGKYCPSASTTLNLEAIQEVTGDDVLLTGYELATGSTEEQLAIVATDTVNEAFGKIQKQNYDNEAVVAGALNDLDERITTLEVSGSSSDDLEALSAKVLTNEYVVAAALNDLNARIVELSGNTGAETDPIFSSSVAATITQQDIDNWNNSGGGGAVTAVTVTGTGNAVTDATFTNSALTLTKGNVQATISDLATIRTNAASGMAAYNNVNSLSAATTGINSTLTTVSGAAHNKITALSAATTGINSTLSTVSGAAHNQITSLSAATTGINSTLTTHTGNGDIHVTATQKTTWDGKQDAISDLAAIRNGANSGASAYTAVTALSAATTAHTGNGDIHVTAAQKTAWTNGANSGASAYTAVTALSGATTAHIGNTTVHITSDERTRWQNGWMSGVSAYTKVQQLSASVLTLSAIVEDNEYVAAQAINDWNDRLLELSGVTESLTGGSAGGGITGVSAGGTNVPVANSVAAIPSASSSNFGVVKTGNFLTNTNGSIAVTTGTTSSSVARGDQFLAVSGATTAHTNNGDIHVTSAQKTTWTNQGNSGVSAYTAVTALSAATTAHTATTIPSRTSAQIHLPTVTSSDNFKVPMVSGGTWVMAPVTLIYTGTGDPQSNVGNDGDIYLQTS